MADWNDSLRTWVDEHRSDYDGFSDMCRQIGINRSTFQGYINRANEDRLVEDLGRVTDKNRALLFNATGIEVFKFHGYEAYLPDADRKVGKLREIRTEVKSGVPERLRSLREMVDLLEVELGVSGEGLADSAAYSLERLAIKVGRVAQGDDEDRAAALEALQPKRDLLEYILRETSAWGQSTKSRKAIGEMEMPEFVRNALEGEK